MKNLILISLMMLALSCSNTYTVLKHTHASIPPQFCSTTNGIAGDVTTNQKMVYTLEGEDQYDWNKLAGLKFHYFNARKNACMIGWRYNVEDSVFEFAPYINFQKANIIYNSPDEIVTIPIDSTIHFNISYDAVNWKVKLNDHYYEYPHNYIKAKTYRIVHWFGGTSRANKTIPITFKWMKP